MARALCKDFLSYTHDAQNGCNSSIQRSTGGVVVPTARVNIRKAAVLECNLFSMTDFTVTLQRVKIWPNLMAP